MMILVSVFNLRAYALHRLDKTNKHYISPTTVALYLKWYVQPGKY